MKHLLPLITYTITWYIHQHTHTIPTTIGKKHFSNAVQQQKKDIINEKSKLFNREFDTCYTVLCKTWVMLEHVK